MKVPGPEEGFSDHTVSASLSGSFKWRGGRNYYENSVEGGIAKGLSMVSGRRMRLAPCDV